MSSAREHHARAEQLLEEARTTQDQISRRLILAEAQVHATLALSAPAGTALPGGGQPATGYAFGRATGWSGDSAGFGLPPYGSGGETALAAGTVPGKIPSAARGKSNALPARRRPRRRCLPARTTRSPLCPIRHAPPGPRGSPRNGRRMRNPSPRNRNPGGRRKDPLRATPGNRNPAARHPSPAPV